jgi:hypothetical protein
MLFFENNPSTQGADKPDELSTKGKGVIDQLTDLKTAITQWVIPDSVENAKKVFENISTQLTTMEDSALALQKTMGGFVTNTTEFRQSLEGAFLPLTDIGVTFKDAAEVVQGLATQMGRIVSPSKEVVTNSLTFSKAANMTSTETGKMVADFSQFGGTQLEAITQMSELGKSARKSGLDAKSFTTEVAKNLKQASLFGFKGGVKDIEEMVKKTKLLGTSLEKLGIGTAAKGLLDPEKAMETAANIQMIGGNIGALGDPFQLLYMGQKDMKKLTDEVLNMSKATFTFDKATGAFTQTTEDMYALRAQAEALGINYEETANAGKELAKVDFVKSKTKLAEKITDEDTQNLIAGLAQISKEGEVSIKLPGMEKEFKSLDDALADADFNKNLIEYQEKANLSDKDLTIAQMSIAEKQGADVNVIKNAVLANMTENKREQVLMESIAQNSKTMGDLAKATANGAANKVEPLLTKTNTSATKAAEVSIEFLKNLNIEDFFKDISFENENTEDNNNNGGEGGQLGTEDIDENQLGGGQNNSGGGQLGGGQNNSGGGQLGKLEDGFFPSGDKPTLMSRGKIYQGLDEDSVYVGTDFEKIFSRAKNATNILSEVMSQKSSAGRNTEVSGKIDFGTLTVKVDAPSGVDKSLLEQTLNSRQFTTHIMNMVANQKSFYSNQSTLEG